MCQDEAISIRPARGASDLEAAAVLITAYVKWLDIDLTYQDFESEMRSLPGKYSPPNGEILLAFDRKGQAIGCVALRPMPEEGCCEMKRLYVTPAGRSTGAGKMLIQAMIELARDLQYKEIKLDTLPHMTKAIGLYKRFGFEQIRQYYDTPIIDTVFLRKLLSS